MQTRHTAIDSPLGELTLAADDDAPDGTVFPAPLACAHGGRSGPVR